MRYPNWVCITCGRPFSRKWNVKRHIDICHYGIGKYITFAEYLAGRNMGLYGPSTIPSKSQSRSIDFAKIFQEEATRELARQSIRNQNSQIRNQKPPVYYGLTSDIGKVSGYDLSYVGQEYDVNRDKMD
jgi:hypothetical protein